MNEQQFKRDVEVQGYGDLREVEYEPNSTREMHRHDFSAYLLVLEGELTLVTDDRSVRYKAGETCQLAAGTLHAEQTGASGAKMLVAKR